MSVSQWVSDLENHFRAVETTAQQFLAEHVPGLAEFARKVESSPLLQAAEVALATLSPEAEAVLAKFVTDFANLVPTPPAPEPTPIPEPEPAPAA